MELKVGDLVVQERPNGEVSGPHTVTRVSPKRFQTAYSDWYSKETGQSVRWKGALPYSLYVPEKHDAQLAKQKEEAKRKRAGQAQYEADLSTAIDRIHDIWSRLNDSGFDVSYSEFELSPSRNVSFRIEGSDVMRLLEAALEHARSPANS